VPDGGMRHMTNPLGITTYKSCSGHKGHRECAEEYPVGWLPADKFHLNQGMCKACMAYRNAIMHSEAPRHPITNQLKWDWKKSCATKLGGKQNTPGWQAYLDGAELQWNIEYKNYILDKRPAQEYFDWIDLQNEPKKSNIAPFFYPPEHEKRLKSAGRTVESAIKARNAQKVDGFIYTATHPLWPEIKIGFTFNPPSRLGTFNTCCPHRLFCMPYISTYLKNAKSGEDAIHETLKDFREGGEWFKVSLELATETIEDYIRSLDDDTKE